MGENYKIRYMLLEDIDDVLKVEQNSFATPWSRTAFVNELVSNKFAHYLVLVRNEKTIGYCGVWVIVDEAHITNIAIHSDFRGLKLGEQLLVHAIELSRTLGATKVTLEVRVSNHVAQRLYAKLGFQPGGIRKNYYTDNQEDALVMWVVL
ncbi:ribosomal-protein-alanine N-acetyltransferase [Anaerobacillus alkalidiazotrophicus]|uniref:[Ribosomal protein bS18]-alanine N-acetyltransferase n=1 Tax=Anaerobacillus alkalidiazotrophicus TaxID=472963 RepID=A0A1S2LWM7_9BACI|nr:ribosomal protein S18-alanine N-acetyltransferase [Anaerobacillus alkalidiazotrophicus]OIJ16951.1 ribosomal-protein-alanine N-acetyltransferase [Anaerobacillus alkalidiazotrophicus]